MKINWEIIRNYSIFREGRVVSFSSTVLFVRSLFQGYFFRAGAVHSTDDCYLNVSVSQELNLITVQSVSRSFSKYCFNVWWHFSNNGAVDTIVLDSKINISNDSEISHVWEAKVVLFRKSLILTIPLNHVDVLERAWVGYFFKLFAPG